MGVAVDASFGPYAAERLSPFSNAHLLEESLDGSYAPAADPLFLLSTVVVGALAFFGVFAWAARGADRSGFALAGFALGGLLVLVACLLRFAFDSEYPAGMQFAVLVRLGVFAGLGLLGLFAGHKPAVHGR
ncbi:hypothetical protein [Ahniella affigens]|nr:hypothetical protein [Ahniella affigens]